MHNITILLLCNCRVHWPNRVVDSWHHGWWLFKQATRFTREILTYNTRNHRLLHCMLSCGTVYCNQSCLWVCLWVCYHDNSKIVCIDPHQTGFVGKGSMAGENVWLRLTTASAQCLRLL